MFEIEREKHVVYVGDRGVYNTRSHVFLSVRCAVYTRRMSTHTPRFSLGEYIYAYMHGVCAVRAGTESGCRAVVWLCLVQYLIESFGYVMAVFRLKHKHRAIT